MPKLETYTATGQVRSGPVAAPVDASVLTAPYRALERTGNQIANVGDQVAQLANQRQREDDLRWATEASAQYSRTLAERRAADAQNPRETEGQEFRDFADEQLAEYAKNAPSQRARDMFRSHGLSTANSGYERALHSGEQTRLINADLANDKAAADIVATYKTTEQLDNPVGAAQDISGLVNSQLASIDTRFGKTMPALAEKMRKTLVSEVALGTASTNPEYARQLVASAPIEEKFKLTLNNEIDRIVRDSRETNTFNIATAITHGIKTGLATNTPVPMPSKATLDLLPPNQAAALVQEVEVANYTTSLMRDMGEWNWMAQRQKVASIDTTNDPVARLSLERLAEKLDESKKEQQSDPAGWQLRNVKEFRNIGPNETIAQRDRRISRMISLQGEAPADATPEEAKRYLHLPTGLHKAISNQEATIRAQRFNTTPNQLTKLIEELKSEYADPKVAGMVWNDMMHLPESQRLRMGIRVGASIENVDARNHYIGGISKPLPRKPSEPDSAYESQLFADGSVYNKFADAWKGDGNQRGQEIDEFKDSILKYAKYISVEGESNVSAKEAVNTAVRRVISENYGIVPMFGVDVPVHRFPSPGVRYSDEDMEMIGRGVSGTLRNPDVDKLNTDIRFFPLQPQLPGSKDEANRYLRDLITSSATLSVEPDGKTATVYVKGKGADDFAFQLRTKDGKPVVLNFTEMLVRGDLMDLPFNDTEARKRETEQRLGIPPAPKIRGVYR